MWNDWRYLLALVLTTVLMRCNGTRRDTKVIYNSVTSHTSLSGAGASVQRGNSYYQKLYVDNTDTGNIKLVVGGTNSIEIYDVGNVASVDQESFTLPLKEPSGGLACNFVKDQALCENFINVIDKTTTHWYYCGTSGINPQCWVCDARMCTSGEISGASFVAEDFVRADPVYNQPFYITDSLVFGAAVENGFARSDVMGDGTFSEPPTMITTYSSETRLINLEREYLEYIGDPIEYTNADSDTHIYYFFRERAVEYVQGSTAIYSRVGRVCKDDMGGPSGSLFAGKFTTFLKARLNCSVTGGDFPYNYDYLRDVYRSPSGGGKILYAAFTDNTVWQANSAICVYHLDEIAAVFKNSKFKGQATVSSLWLPYNEAAINPRPGTCSDPHQASDYQTLSQYALMDQTIPNKQAYSVGSTGAYDRDSDPPVMVLDGLYVTKLVVHENGPGNNDIFFLGTADGKVYKAYVEGSGSTAQTRLIEVIDLSISSSTVCTEGNYHDCDERVLSMLFHSETVFVGTLSSLHEIPVQHCADYTTYEDCVRAQDPYCGAVSAGTPCVSVADPSSDQCLQPDPFSCDPLNFPAPSFFDPTGCETSEAPTYIRGPINNAPESTIQVSMWAQADEGSVWGDTMISCACGCPPIEMTEIRALSTHDNKEYQLGSYDFDMSSCTNDVDIMFTLKANGNPITKTVSVEIDSTDMETDSNKIALMTGVDEQIHAYYYQACWWKRNMETQRNAQDVYCYDCGNT